MSMQIQCKCGWSSQVSEFYLGDAVCCPDCGTRIRVHAQSGVPYGYAPYPTWSNQRKRPPAVRLPATKRAARPGPYDDSSRPALGLAVLAAFFVITGVFVLPGLVLAVVSLHLTARSRSAGQGNGVPVPGRTKVATWLSAAVLVLCPLVFFAAMPGVEPQRATSSVEQHENTRNQVTRRALAPAYPQDAPAWQSPPEFRYPTAPTARPAGNADYRRNSPAEAAPASPAPAPEVPASEFERYQSDYSRQVAAERRR